MTKTGDGAQSVLAVLGLGSNTQARIKLLQCLDALANFCQPLAISRLYENQARNEASNSSGAPAALHVHSAMYVNAAIVVRTSESLTAFYKLVKDIEQNIGGNRLPGVCALDIDLIAFNDFSGFWHGHFLPRQPSCEEGYFWCALRDLAPLKFEHISTPAHWIEMHWPEIKNHKAIVFNGERNSKDTVKNEVAAFLMCLFSE